MGNCMESEGAVPINNSIFNPTMINHTIDVYYFTMSPPARGTLMLVRALGLKHNAKLVNILAGEQNNPEFLKLNPIHQVPVLVDNGFVLTESNAIMKYLVQQYAKDDSLYPRNPKKAAIVTERQFFGATYLLPRFIGFYAPTLFGDMPPDPENKVKLEEALNRINGFLNNKKWIAGDDLTIADFFIISIISTIEACGTFDLTHYTDLWQWYLRTKNVLSSFGYEEVNQPGANAFANAYKSKLSQM